MQKSVDNSDKYYHKHTIPCMLKRFVKTHAKHTVPGKKYTGLEHVKIDISVSALCSQVRSFTNWPPRDVEMWQ